MKISNLKPMCGSSKWTTHFKVIPNKDLLDKVLKCFNITNIECCRVISKVNNDPKVVCLNFINVIPDLCMYYHQRLIQNYFYVNQITFNKCIVILRNISYHLGYIMLGGEIITNKKKIQQYQIVNKVDYLKSIEKTISITHNNNIISFD